MKKAILKRYKRFIKYISRYVFHDKYTMTIGRYAVIKSRNKIRYVSRIPLPASLCKAYHIRFNSEMLNLFGGKNAFKQFRRMMKVDIRIVRLKCIFYALQADSTNPDSLSMFKRHYRREWKDENDTLMIHEEILRLQGKEEEIIHKIKEDGAKNEDDFYLVIADVEDVLKQEFSMKMTLHSFIIKFNKAKDLLK